MSLIKEMDKSNNDTDYNENPWVLIGSYFKDQHLQQLVKHQLESYNSFVNYQIKKTIDMFNPVSISSEQSFDEISGKNALEVKLTLRIFRYIIHKFMKIMEQLS